MPSTGSPARLQVLAQRFTGGASEGRGDDRAALGLGDIAQGGFENLAKVEMRVQGVEAVDQLHRAAIGEVRHLLIGEHGRDDPFGAVAVGELVAGLGRVGIVEPARRRLREDDAALGGGFAQRDEGGEQVFAGPEITPGVRGFVPGLEQGGFGVGRGQRLAHHVDRHQQVVGVVVLEEGDHQRVGAQDGLRRIVDDLDFPIADLGAAGNREDLADIGAFGGFEGIHAPGLPASDNFLAVGDEHAAQVGVARKPVGRVQRLRRLLEEGAGKRGERQPAAQHLGQVRLVQRGQPIPFRQAGDARAEVGSQLLAGAVDARAVEFFLRSEGDDDEGLPGEGKQTVFIGAGEIGVGEQDDLLLQRQRDADGAGIRSAFFRRVPGEGQRGGEKLRAGARVRSGHRMLCARGLKSSSVSPEGKYEVNLAAIPGAAVGPRNAGAISPSLPGRPGGRRRRGSTAPSRAPGGTPRAFRRGGR